MIVGFPAGNASDIVARLVARYCNMKCWSMSLMGLGSAIGSPCH
jgi:tripartite-type tricarboxylate transporter receptor subunit TctC